MALLTGAGRGIGLGIAKALAAQGCAVAIQDIEPAVAVAAADVLKQQGARAIGLGGDIGELELLRGLVDETVAQLGELHILINNAAIQKWSPWIEITADDMMRVYRANVIAPLMLAQFCVPIFQKQHWGRIINLGSIQQRGGHGPMLPYSMSKASIYLMTKALAREVGKDGITVNLIAPGYYNTWRNRSDFSTPEEKAKRGERSCPMGRIGEPEDCGGAAVLLCSEAGGYITGQSLFIDGGMSAR